MDQPREHVFASLSSTNERLLAEMNQFLDSIDHSAVSSKIDGAKSSSGKAPGQNANNVMKEKASRNGNLISIDEVKPQEYEYYNDIAACGTNQSVADSNNLDDDSLVVMAKRMDDASIVSDITAPPETPFLAIMPQPKKITAGMKKLGQKIKSAPPPRKAGDTSGPGPGFERLLSPRSPPRNPPRVNNNHQPMNFQNGVSSSFSTTKPTQASLNKREHSPSSSGSPLSSNESTDSRPANKQCEPPGDNPNSSEPGAVHSGEQLSSAATRAAIPSRLQKGRDASSPRETAEESKPDCRSSKKKNENRSCSPTEAFASKGGNPTRRSFDKKKNRNHRIPSIEDPAKCRAGGGGSSIYVDPMPGASAYFAQGNATTTSTSHKIATKSNGDANTRRGKTRRKKRRQKPQDDDSDEDTMQGIGFNTRIHTGGPKVETAPDRTLVQTSMPSHSPNALSATTSRMPTKTTTRAEAKMSDQCESSESERGSENDNHSAYDSDDQTQIFYESEEDFSSEEELLAVGTSVADAVKDLNERRTVTKVKNLFGIRGR